jgi:hypothetical protein
MSLSALQDGGHRRQADVHLGSDPAQRQAVFVQLADRRLTPATRGAL